MSKLIHNPALAEIQDISETAATFVVSPLEPGYGNTLGNSLRRVLLSSINGAAITAFKIEGVNHEFTAIDGVKEDVVDIMLNLKNIKFKAHTDSPVELRLEKTGSGVITAADIEANAEMEVVNPDQIIATIDDEKTKIAMNFVVESGHGYKTIEESSEDRIHSDMIALDAIFSPVLRVRFKVDSTRVGQNSNLDRLDLTVETDGSISPREAFEQAAAILVNQYTALAGSTTMEAAPALGENTEEESNELLTPIEDLNLTARTTNALVNNNIRTVHDLINLTEQDLRELKGFGSKALDEVKDKIAELNL
ncbi:MAG: DNA-directed RNA polymerase subunit alpha [bacterium]|nr:DNA-directed RNA polymerase subunit alpha [bacterium]